MTTSSRFLQPTGAVSYSPNYINAEASGVSLLNYSLPANGSLSQAEANTLVNGGVSAAIAQAYSSFDNEFKTLFGASEALGVGLEESYQGKSDSNTRVVASFDVSQGKPLSFDFATGINLQAKEIDNPNAEFNAGRAKSAFLVLDTSSGRPTRVLGYYGIQGRLVSSEKIANFREGARKGALRAISNLNLSVDKNIDQNDGRDFLTATVRGTYSQSFRPTVSEVTLVQVTDNASRFVGDTLIGNLGGEVTYGTLRRDYLSGSNGNDSFYGSWGNDIIRGYGGDDILEGGPGNDRLHGNAGNDKVHGGDGQDVIDGDRGSDMLAGGKDADIFVLSGLRRGDVDTILDFELGIDKLRANSLGSNPQQRFFQNLIDTPNGAQFTADGGGQVLFSGLTADALKSADALFD